MSDNNNTAIATQNANIADRMVVSVKGQDGKEVKITKRILMDTICHGMQISDADMVQFLTLCQVNQLNPFLREVYLVKYGSQPSQMITSKEAFMKRADRCQDFEGIESGVIGMNEQNVIQDFEGAFLPPKWQLIGGWAKVYRHGRRPYVQRVALAEYNKKQSTWNAMPLSMIRKVAEVQALREAFPNNLSGMYVSDEMSNNRYIEVADEVKQEKSQFANKEEVSFDAQPAPSAKSKAQQSRPLGSVGSGSAAAKAQAPAGVDPETGEIKDAAADGPDY